MAADLRLDEVIGDFWRDGQERRIAHDGELGDHLLMQAHELEMPQHRAEAVPIRQPVEADDEVGNAVGLVDVAVDGLRQRLEIN